MVPAVEVGFFWLPTCTVFKIYRLPFTPSVTEYSSTEQVSTCAYLSNYNISSYLYSMYDMIYSFDTQSKT